MRLLTSDNYECKLLDNNFSYAIQIFLGIVSVSSLIFKRHIERPQRTWKIWCFDVSKQLVAGFFTHITNILVAEYILNTKNSDECAWYFLNFFIDCTVGICIVYFFHDGLCYILKFKFKFKTFAKIGYYGDPPKIHNWFKQFSVYLLALMLNKLIIVPSMYYFQNYLGIIGNKIFHNIQDKPNLELLIVMILCPWVLTTFQYWIFDYMLKKKTNMISNQNEYYESSNESDDYRLISI